MEVKSRWKDKELWTAKEIKESWVKQGEEIILTHERGFISAIESSAELWENFPDKVEDLQKAGWVLKERLGEKEIELMPSLYFHDVVKAISEIAPEVFEDKEKRVFLRGLIKRYTHVVKHDVYSRIQMLTRNPSLLKEVLDGKKETHRDYSRIEPELLGINFPHHEKNAWD